MTENPTVPAATPETPALDRITRDGLTIFKRYAGDDSAYYCKIEVRRKQHMLKLSANANESFKKARALRAELRAARLEAVDQILDGLKERRPTSPLKDLFARYETNAPAATGIAKKTAAHNVNAIRNLIRHALEDQTLTEDQIGALPTSTISPALLEKYKRQVHSAAGENKLQQDRSAITANSTIRQARSLFCKKLPADFYKDLVLPDLEPLRAVRLLPEPRDGFSMPAPALVEKVRAAAPALKIADPNAYLVYLLSLVTGLRANEIAHARARWIESHIIEGKPRLLLRVQTETDFRPKSKQQRLVPLSDAVHAEILELTITALPGVPDYILRGSATERRDQSFRRFSAWLKNLGWDRLKKAHEFRKIFGSHVAHQAGLRAAQEMLGHAQYSTTERHYVGQVEVPKYSIPHFG